MYFTNIFLQELAYVHQRYKEIHDFLHTLLNLGTSVPDEIILKWFEMI
jgi:ubiquinone biosynthesis protein COQ4